MHFTTKGKAEDGSQDRYVCARYKGRDWGECSSHYIRETVLRQIVLERIRALTTYVREDAMGFREAWMHCQRSQQEKSIRQDQKRLAQAKKRHADIDRLVKKTYEDYSNGILTLERYRKLADDYEGEQNNLACEIKNLEAAIEEQKEQTENCERFMALIHKYADIPELTQTIVHEFVKKIVVHEADKSTGIRTQDIDILFNFIEDFDIPALSAPVTVATNNSHQKTA